MSDTFDIEADEYCCSVDDLTYKKESDYCDHPAIYSEKGIHHFTKKRCEAFLRKLAELSDENELDIPHGVKISTNDGYYLQIDHDGYDESELEAMLEFLRKAKYQAKPLTAEEKIKKALLVLKKASIAEGYKLCDEAVNILESK